MPSSTDKTKNNKQHKHHDSLNNNEKRKDPWFNKTFMSTITDETIKHSRNNTTGSRRTESVLSCDSDIRFTRKKLGDSQRCGCALIAGFLLILLLSGAAVYFGYTYLRSEPLPDRIFKGKLTVTDGDKWLPDFANQNSIQFHNKARDYRERINLLIKRSDLRNSYIGNEILALDGMEEKGNIIVHFILQFEPYRSVVTANDLTLIFLEEINSKNPRYFDNLKIDPTTLLLKEVLGQIDDLQVTSTSPLAGDSDVINIEEIPKRICEPIKLNYCKSVGYNMTTYPNFLGHQNLAEVEADVITFREMVDGECFRQAFDFICRLLQPPCELRQPLDPLPGQVCREYCQLFWNGCAERLPERFKKYFDCERFPESTGIQSCSSRPGCAADLQLNSLSSRLCDGIADCPDLSDEMTCAFCPANSLYCGKGRACIPRTSRCDGKMDCPDGSDEKDCLSISPLVKYLTSPSPIIPHRSKFHTEGFAVFSEKGGNGKLCAEGMDTDRETVIRNTVSESLCKALGFEKVIGSEVRNDTEPGQNYVRVLDPRSAEISFVRTACRNKQALYVSCENLECGTQSAVSISNPNGLPSLPKLASHGDWPWHVALFKSDTHVCDGTLISAEWVLTTESCFQGQQKATWQAVLGIVRLSSNPPWLQKRRIVGMVKSPVEGSTICLIRLQTPIVFNDFIRPICLTDLQTTKQTNKDSLSIEKNIPKAERFARSRNFKEETKYFSSPVGEFFEDIPNAFNADFIDESSNAPRAEAFNQNSRPIAYPIEQQSPQIRQYETQMTAFGGKSGYSQTINPGTINYLAEAKVEQQHQWSQCNTLGWARQKEHLQRVQLKLTLMASCENISIATVNSICTETVYHKQDCNEEEFAGSPIVCLLPDNRRWALVGISSWRIACAPSGIERPRMYDKISSNTAWIRDTINST